MLNPKPIDEPLPRYASLYQKISSQEKQREKILDEIEQNEHELHYNLTPELIQNYQDFILELQKKAGGVANLFSMIEGKPLHIDN